ncbi:hypothetical protein K469DRAFT_747956 [Zopfia rhizophila CBS 207.26]|uniref:Uncharacterized protein n=1 Tax=Zopfia rhizophila CBS 207.26 TaxID=1314779 RepID=A0A6A6EF27_9PEZI|nr:hypothetical protein K469DRAFT_747956 [Zopfia rhizophila CBS 207.26]
MDSRNSSKIQPWLTEYEKFAANIREGKAPLKGTTHGFNKGVEVIMDGNSSPGRTDTGGNGTNTGGNSGTDDGAAKGGGTRGTTVGDTQSTSESSDGKRVYNNSGRKGIGFN